MALPYLTTEDLTTRHEAGWYISETPMGVEVGRGRTPTQAIDAAARILCGLSAGPDDWDDLPTDAPGGDDPAEGPYERLPRESRQEIDLLCRCADGEHIRDWAYIDALAAYVARTYVEVCRG